jgi:pyrimidine operon attenuation protein/uracil phosphoribosyltransferase
MKGDHVKILEKQDVQARIKRIAFEIYENNFQEESLILIGADERGDFIAELLQAHLLEISPLKIELWHASFDKKDRQGRGGRMQVNFSHELNVLAGKNVVIVDDVLYSGNTMLHLVAPLLEVMPNKIEVAVLIDRGHRNMPISPNYVGLELATTIHQVVAVEVDFEERFIEAYLV